MSTRATPTDDRVAIDAVRTVVHDFAAAVALLTMLPLPRPSEKSPRFGRATLFFPLVGLLLGAVLAGINALCGRWLPPLVVVGLLVAAWEGLTGLATVSSADALVTAVWSGTGVAQPADRRALARLFGIALIAAKAGGLAAAPLSRTAAVLFAPLLGRWGMVVVAHGARDAQAPGQKYAPAIAFREFALASVFTLAVLLSLTEALGVLVAICVAALAVGIRLLLHRRAGGVSWGVLVATAQVIETLVVLLFAAV